MIGLIRRVRSLLLFLVIPGLSAASPLLLYPAVVSQHGSSGFASLAVAQSVGTAAGVISELGWNVVGPQQVAGTTSVERERLYRASIASRLCACAPAAMLAAVVTYSIVADETLAAALIAAGMTFAALSPSWYLTGLNKPGVILLADTLPRVTLTASAALLVSIDVPLVVIAAIAPLTAIVGFVVVSRVAGASWRPRRADFAEAPSLMRRHIPLVLGRGVSVMYTSLLTALVGFVATSAVPLYAATDRILRMGLNVLSGVPSRMQSWVGAVTGSARRHRSRQSLVANITLGAFAGPVFILVAPWVAGWLFLDQIPITPLAAILGGCTAFMVCVSRGLGLSLVAEQRANSIAAANIGAAVVGVLCVLVLVPTMGAYGALLAALSAESAGVLVQSLVLLRRRPGPAEG